MHTHLYHTSMCGMGHMYMCTCTTLQLLNMTAHVFSVALVQMYMYVYGFIIMSLNVVLVPMTSRGGVG